MKKSELVKVMPQIKSFLEVEYPNIKIKMVVEGDERDALLMITAYDFPYLQIIAEDIMNSGLVDKSGYWVEGCESKKFVSEINKRCELEGVHFREIVTGWAGSKPIIERQAFWMDYHRIKKQLYDEMYSLTLVENNVDDLGGSNIYQKRDYKGNLWTTLASDEWEAEGNIELGMSGVDDVFTFISA